MRHDYENFDLFYEDEPIHIAPEKAKNLTPPEYRDMKKLDFASPFSFRNDAQIFYLQAKYMEHFEDDAPYDQEFFSYYPTYRNMSTPELRGYFTWRTRLRHGDLSPTSRSYAYLYLYELIHMIGSDTKEDGLQKLISFHENYCVKDKQLAKFSRQWIKDYAVYYHIDPAMISDYSDHAFDEALDALHNCEEASDDALFSAVTALSSYRTDKSKLFKKYPDETKRILCEAYRRMDRHYHKLRGKSYATKLYGSTIRAQYTPFLSAVFFDHLKQKDYEYRISPLQSYACLNGQWTVEKAYLSPQKNKELGVFVRAADRMLREEYQVSPALKFDLETDTMVGCIQKALEEFKEASKPQITFDLSLLGDIRRNADITSQKLMTEEERGETAEPIASGITLDASASVPAEVSAQTPGSDRDEVLAARSATAEVSDTAPAVLPLSGHELTFLQLLLAGQSTDQFLREHHLMSSVLADSVNEQLYDEFADTVIEFDGDTPVLVEDYIEDLKGMIPT